MIVSSFVIATSTTRFKFSHSLDHNGRTTNDGNGLLLILLNKQAKWVLFVAHPLLPHFSFSLYWTLCHVCVSVIFFLSLSPPLLLSYFDYNKMVSCWYDTTMERCFEENLRNDPITWNINDDEYVLDSYLSAMNSLFSICVYKV